MTQGFVRYQGVRLDAVFFFGTVSEFNLYTSHHPVARHVDFGRGMRSRVKRKRVARQVDRIFKRGRPSVL